MEKEKNYDLSVVKLLLELAVPALPFDHEFYQFLGSASSIYLCQC